MTTTIQRLLHPARLRHVRRTLVLPVLALAVVASLNPAALHASTDGASPAVTPSVVLAQRTSASTTSSVSSSWGFKVLLWSRTIADPWALNRQYYFNKCNPKPGVREFRFKTSWIYTTYECWAVLA